MSLLSMVCRGNPAFGGGASRLWLALLLAAQFAPLADALTTINKNTNGLVGLNDGQAWTGGIAPGATNIARWNSATTTLAGNGMGAALSWAGIIFTNWGADYEIAGGFDLTLGASGINSGTANRNLTLSNTPNRVILGASQTWKIANGQRLVVNSTVSGDATNVLTKSGAGTLQLNASNTYSGGTIISTGLVALGDSHALGSGLLTLKGGGLSSSDTTARLITNSVQMSANGSFGDAVHTGVVTLSGGLDFGGGNRTLTVDSDLVVRGTLANGGPETKLGTGTLTFAGGTGAPTGQFETRRGTMVLDGVNLTHPNGGLRILCNTSGEIARCAITNGGLFQFNSPSLNQNVRIGSSNPAGDPGATNILDVAGTLWFPAGFPAGSVLMGASCQRAVLNLLPGGVLAVNNFTHQGNTTEVNLDGGTLRAITNNAAFLTGLSQAYVRDRGVAIDTAGFDITVAQALLDGGGGGLTKLGAGTLTLAGANTYGGPTIVSNGTLNTTTASTGSGVCSIAGSAALGLKVAAVGSSLRASGLTCGSGAVLNIDCNSLGTLTAPALADSGGLTVDGNVTVNVLNGAAVIGTNVLLAYAGPRGGSGRFVAGTMPVSFPLEAAIVDDVTNQQVRLEITYSSSAPRLKWAAGDGNWDTTTANWIPLAGGATTNYAEGNLVTFNDDASGSSPITVTPTASRMPADLTVSNVAKDFKFTGGGVAGPTGLVKDGPGKLILANANTFEGPTTVTAGLLQVGDGGTTGALGSGPVTVNGTIVFNRSDSLVVSNLIGGTGGIVQQGTGSTMLSGLNTYAGATVVSAGTLALKATNNTGAGPMSVADGAALQLDVSGPSTWHVSDATLGSGGSIILNLNYGTLLTNPVGAAVQTVGSVTAGATNVLINVGGVGFKNGRVPLIQYGGSLAGRGYPSFRLGAVPANFQATLVNNTTNKSIDLELVRQSSPPNVLMILSDDQGYWDTGFQGSTDIPTPNLDRLAREGVRCTSGYVTHPYCSPTRAALMTGRYQHRFGHEANPVFNTSDHRQGVPTTEKLLPELLAPAGYLNGWIGKWHLGAAPELHPEARGFAETFGFLGGGHQYQNWTPGTAEYTIPLQRNGQPVDVTNHLTVAFGQEAGDFVRRHSTQPWFLYLAFNAPHTPLQPTTERYNRFASITNTTRRNYAAQVSLLDDAVGEALTALRDTGQQSNTLVFFFSDNGGPITVNGSLNTPLRGQKGNVYEGGVRVPFVVSWPGTLPSGVDYTQMVSSLDVLATSLAVAGVPMPTNRVYDGVNLIPFLSGQNPGAPHAQLFWRSGGSTASGAIAAARKGDWKYCEVGGTEIYHLNPDGTGETTNLATNNPQKVLELMSAFAQWESGTMQPLWVSSGNNISSTTNPWVDSSDLGWRLDGTNSTYTPVVITLRDPIQWDADFTLHWSMKTTASRTNQNGFVALGSGFAASQQIFAGLDRTPGQMLIIEPGSGGQSQLGGVSMSEGVLDLQLAYARADNSLTLRFGTNTLKRFLSTNYPAVSCLGYAVRGALSEFGWVEIDPPFRLAIQDALPVRTPAPGVQMDVQVERGMAGSLTIERTASLPAPFAPLTNQPQLFLGNKLFRLSDSAGAATNLFYRVRGQP